MKWCPSCGVWQNPGNVTCPECQTRLLTRVQVQGREVKSRIDALNLHGAHDPLPGLPALLVDLKILLDMIEEDK
jgi:hypothetical protein